VRDSLIHSWTHCCLERQYWRPAMWETHSVPFWLWPLRQVFLMHKEKFVQYRYFYKGQVRGEVVLCLVNWVLSRKRMGEWRYSSRILGTGTKWKRMASLTPGLLYPKLNNSGYSSDRSLSGPQTSHETFCLYRE
jgi:hypothetical protein